MKVLTKILIVSAFYISTSYSAQSNLLKRIACSLKQSASFHHSAKNTAKCPFLERLTPFIKEQEEVLKTRLESSRLDYELFQANLARINFQSGYPFVAIAAQNARNEQQKAINDFHKALEEKATRIGQELAKEMKESQYPKHCPGLKQNRTLKTINGG